MKIIISKSYSIEYKQTTKGDDIEELEKQMREFFKEKIYSSDVENYHIGFIYVHPQFNDFNQPERPKYYADKIFKVRGLPKPSVHFYKYFYLELMLDYTSFFSSNKQEGLNIIANTLLTYLKELKYPLAIRKSFNKEKFNNDMKQFFIERGCTINE